LLFQHLSKLKSISPDMVVYPTIPLGHHEGKRSTTW
jgi:hypothetical protein